MQFDEVNLEKMQEWKMKFWRSAGREENLPQRREDGLL